MSWHPLFQEFKYVDRRFEDRWPSASPVYNDIRLQVLLYAGREAAASLNVVVSCTTMGEEHGTLPIRYIAEQGMLYEPFTYWDWHGYDAEGKPLDGSRYLHEGGRKKRLLWERERAFLANGDKHGGLTPRERWEGFKRFVQRKRRRRGFVRRIAVANWMTKEDMEWIAKTLSRLEALDLSDVPPSYSACSVKNDNTWLGYLRENKDRKPIYKDEFLDIFPYFVGIRDFHGRERDQLADLYKHRHDYAYKTTVLSSSTIRRGPHKKSKVITITEPLSFEDWFWMVQDYIDRGLSPTERLPKFMRPKYDFYSDENRPQQEEISQSHLWRRLKWLGLPDWRSNSYAAQIVGTILPTWCVSMETVSIRGVYTRDLGANEVDSIHHHVCRFILGIKQIVPPSVTKLELRLSVSFLKYFLEQLEKKKPSIKRVGIDLGAWVQIFPLGSPPEHLEDDAIRTTTRRLARNMSTLEVFHPKKNYYRWVQDKEEAFVAEQEYIAEQPSFYRNRSGNIEPTRTIQQVPNAETPVGSEPTDYDFFEDLLHDKTKQNDTCPLDQSITHRYTKEVVDRTRANTLAKLLEKLHLARPMVGYSNGMVNITFRNKKPNLKLQISRAGAELFGLQGEAQTRSFDPIDPLTLTQQEVKTDFRAGADYNFWNPEGLKTVYPWIAEIFSWRPVFDWDWFMVPPNMSATENPDLVTINDSRKRGSSRPEDWKLEGRQSDGRGKPGRALENALGFIKKQFALLNDAGIPVHLLIGRRDLDVSSCYWGWPYTQQVWREWNEQYFSANLETIAEHVDKLSIMYDLRNPIDNDRLSFIDARRPYFPPSGKCPTRVCHLEAHNNGKCPFVEKYPPMRNRHPRLQTKVLIDDPWGQEKGKKKKKDTTPKYKDLADNSSSGPPTGELADDEAKEDDSDDEEVFPLRLARRSVYSREGVGWTRFWEAYATSFSRLTVLHVRMPQSGDKASSWRLARLLNRKNGWYGIYYPDERQHMQSDEDLLTSFDGDKGTKDGNKVWEHLKESRVWPAGRFVRRTWVWEPLRLVESFSLIEEPDPKNSEGTPKVVGKEYSTFRFEPRVKRELLSHDNVIEVGEIQALKDGRLDAENAIANEEDNLDPLDTDGESIKPANERIPRPERLPHVIPGFEDQFKSTYGSHVKNVAGAQWREELRTMLSFIQSGIDKSYNTVDAGDGFFGNEYKWLAERDRLKELLAQEPPYSQIFELRDDKIALRDVQAKQWDDDDDEDSLPDAQFDSLFVDSEPEAIVALPPSSLTSSSLPLPKPNASPPLDRPGDKKPPTAGPFEQSSPGTSSEDDGFDDFDNKKGSAVKAEAIKINTDIPKKLLDLENFRSEGVVRTPTMPIDEDYTDDDDADEEDDMPAMLNGSEAAKAATRAHQEEQNGGDSEAIPPPTVQQGSVAASLSKRKKPETADVPSKKPKVSKAEKEAKPQPEKKRKPSDPTPSPSAPPKKPKFSSAPAPNDAILSSSESESDSDPALARPPSKPSHKRKAPPPTTVPESASKKPKKTKSGRVTKPVIEQPSDEGLTSDDAATTAQKDGRTHSKTDYIPPPTTKKDGGDFDSDSESDVGDKKKKPKKMDKGKGKARTNVTTRAAAPAPAPAPAAAPAPPGIQVPTRADGTPDYDRVTVVNLRALAKQRTLKLTGAKRKAEIVKKFQDDDAARRGGGAGGAGAAGGVAA